MQELYQEWLIDQLQGGRGALGYSELYRIMHSVPFLPMVDMDLNRDDDGLNLVIEWAEESYNTDDQIADAIMSLEDIHRNGFCTMLELLVVMSRKIKYELTNSEYDQPIGAWAELLVKNIGLDEYFNGRIEEDWEASEDAIIETLGSVIFRRYGWDGEGGFFPLEHPVGDQREEELLNQMNNYIAENYDIC